MDHISAIMLLGGLRRSSLEVATRATPACLPLAADCSLLEAWFGVIARFGCADLTIVTSGGASDREIDAAIRDSQFGETQFGETQFGDAESQSRPDRVQVADGESNAGKRRPSMAIARRTESASHRGTGGLLRDTASGLAMAEGILFVEPHCVPPATLEPLGIDWLGQARDQPSGPPMVVGVAQGGAPAGACLMRRELLELAPRIGYHDFKEQFLPLVAARGIAVRAVPLQATGVRVHDLGAYRAAVAGWLGDAGPSIAKDALVEPGARVIGSSVVMPGARIGARAIVQDSIVLSNAAIGSGAVVARSVVPAGFRVAPRSLVVDRVLDAETSAGADELVALGVSDRRSESDRQEVHP